MYLVDDMLLLRQRSNRIQLGGEMLNIVPVGLILLVRCSSEKFLAWFDGDVLTNGTKFIVLIHDFQCFRH
jgi:hypothetical protein